MSDKPDKEKDKKSGLTPQAFTSLIDESLFSVIKVIEAIGLGQALRNGTWQLGTMAMKEILKNVFNLKINGRENIPSSTAAIICTKNSSGAYPLLAWIAVAENGNRILYQAFDIEFFKIPGLKSILNMLDSIEVTDGTISAPAKEHVAKKLGEKELIGMALENVKRLEDSEQIMLNADMIEIAKTSNVPIIPVAITNVDDVFDVKTKKISLNQKISITIHKAYTAHLEGKDSNENLEELKTILQQA
nr:1-acyl-sn-glycerol-3-phosphate acyltransferase [Candidatus Sigynarchaeota archaeon]